MGIPGGTELIIIFLVVLLLFGVGRIAKVGKEFGTGIRLFRNALRGSDNESEQEK